MTFLFEAASALRFWVRRPVAAIASVLSLATGLAIGTSIFAVADGTLWKPLPLPSPDRVVWIDSLDRGTPGGTSPGVFSTWATGARSLSAIGALRPAQAIYRDGQPGQRLAGVYASAGVMTVFGVPPVLGRAIGADDDRPAAAPVLIISHRLWQSQYAGSPDVVGRAVTLDGKSRTIVGVMSPSIDRLSFGFDWWAPLALSASAAANVGPRYLDVVGRLGSERATVVEAELSALSKQAGALGDTGAALVARTVSLKRHLSSSVQQVLLPLFAAVLAVVLLGALNAASLLLAQGQTRRAEIAVRASLGASRARIATQLLLESAWLTAAAVAVSLLLSLWLIDSLKGVLPFEQASFPTIALDWRACLFSLGLAAALTSLCGLLPAIRNSAADLRGSLASGVRTATATPDGLRRTLVILQVGLALTIGTAGALMARTTVALSMAPRGYEGRNVLTAATQFPSGDYPTPLQLRSAIDRIVASIGSMPGVSQAAMATRVPLSGGAPGSDLALVSEAFAPGTDRQVRIRFVTPGYFATVGTPLIHGRDVSRLDVASSVPVVLVNDTLARRLAGSAPVVGRSVKFAVADFNAGGQTTEWQVVGVVADARDGGPRADVQAEVYLPMAQGPAGVFDWIGRQVLIAARPSGTTHLDATAMRHAIAEVEPGLALYDVQTLQERFQLHLSTERIAAAVLVPMGVAGFSLAAFGLFTLLMQLVAARRRELAIRMALGATSSSVIRLLVNEAAGLTTIGMLVGTAGALLAGRAIRPLVFGVSTSDPATLTTLIVLTALSAVAAVWLPARRATSVDPAAVLRGE